MRGGVDDATRCVGRLGLELGMAHWNGTDGLGIAFRCVIGSIDIQSLSKSTYTRPGACLNTLKILNFYALSPSH